MGTDPTHPLLGDGDRPLPPVGCDRTSHHGAKTLKTPATQPTTMTTQTTDTDRRTATATTAARAAADAAAAAATRIGDAAVLGALFAAVAVIVGVAYLGAYALPVVGLVFIGMALAGLDSLVSGLVAGSLTFGLGMAAYSMYIGDEMLPPLTKVPAHVARRLR